MATVWIVPSLLQVVIPIALLFWQAASRDRTTVGWVLKAVATTGYIGTTALAGLWLVAPSYLPIVFLVLSLGLAAVGPPRSLRVRAPLPARERLLLTARAIAAVLAVGLLWVALASRLPPPGIVDLDFPLRDGTYYIANGGSNNLTNAHVMTLDPRYAKYRGQSYGIDIVKLNAFGRRADGAAPSDPRRYEIFGDAVYAPCEGVVARVEDWLPDLAPPEVDRVHMPGNFVLIECDDIHVLLGHLRSASVKVHPGDYVTRDTLLGEVGNSGNSNEPHLHIHAQRPGRIWDPFIGDPLPIRLDGRYLVRNDRITRFGPFGSDDID